MNKEKRFIILFFIFLILMIPANYLFNYIIDPFGLKSTKDKFVDQLNQQWVYLYKARVVEKAPYYLLGTSRTEQIDCDLTSNLPWYEQSKPKRSIIFNRENQSK